MAKLKDLKVGTWVKVILTGLEGYCIEVRNNTAQFQMTNGQKLCFYPHEVHIIYNR